MKKIIIFVFMISMAISLAACKGNAPAETPVVSQEGKVDYDFYYPPVEMPEVDYIEDWMLPTGGILTFAEDSGRGYFEITVGNLNGEQYDTYIETLKSNGMTEAEPKIYQRDDLKIKLITTVFNREPGMDGDLYHASYLDIYIYNLR